MSTLDPALAIHIGRDKYCHESILALGKLLPADDAAVANLIDEATSENDQARFIFLLYAALVAGRKVSARHLVHGLQFLPKEADVICVAMHLDGNVATAMAQAVQAVTLAPSRRAVALLAGGLWCKLRQQPVPPELTAQARLLARHHWSITEVHLHLGILTTITEDPTLKPLVDELSADRPELQSPPVRKATESYKEEVLKVATWPILTLVNEKPPATSHVLANGTTMRRAVTRVGRNEPCPCGSGKKYKRCCAEKDLERLHHSSHVSGKTIEEVRSDPEQYLTEAEIEKMVPFQIARLDPLKIKPELHEAFFFHLSGRQLFEEMIQGLEKLNYPDSLFDVWTFGVFQAAYTRNKEALKRLMEIQAYAPKLDNKSREFGADLLLHDHEPATVLKLLNDKAFSLLDEENPNDLASLAFWMLRQRQIQWLGVFMARGAIPLVSDKSATNLLEHVIELREEANLPADDPCSDLLDKRLVKGNDEEDDHSRAAFRKAQRNLEKKAKEVNGLKEKLAQLQRELRLREKRAQREAATPDTKPIADEAHQLAELRKQLDQVTRSLNQTHNERNQYRRELEKATSELEALRSNDHKPAEAENRDYEETLLLPDEELGTQPIRLIEFPRKFDETLKALPKHIARKTMVTLGQIAGAEPTGLAGARRLIGWPDITRQRIGSDYRLLFRLLPDRVQIVDLINRRDLERYLKSLG